MNQAAQSSRMDSKCVMRTWPSRPTVRFADVTWYAKQLIYHNKPAGLITENELLCSTYLLVHFMVMSQNCLIGLLHTCNWFLFSVRKEKKTVTLFYVARDSIERHVLICLMVYYCHVTAHLVPSCLRFVSIFVPPPLFFKMLSSATTTWGQIYCITNPAVAA